MVLHQQPIVAPAQHEIALDPPIAGAGLGDHLAHRRPHGILARQALRPLELAGLRLHEDDAGIARQHDDGVGRDPVVADQAGERGQREVEADHAAPAQRHAGRHADDVRLGEVVGLGQHRRVGAARVDVPGPRARIVVEGARARRAAAAVVHFEPPGLAPRRALALDLAQDDGRPVGRVELQALVDREGLRPAGIQEVAVFVADIHRRHRGIAAEERHQLSETLRIGGRDRRRAQSSAPRRASCRPPRRRAGSTSEIPRPPFRATPCAGRRCAARGDRPPASPATAAPWRAAARSGPSASAA